MGIILHVLTSLICCADHAEPCWHKNRDAHSKFGKKTPLLVCKFSSDGSQTNCQRFESPVALLPYRSHLSNHLPGHAALKLTSEELGSEGGVWFCPSYRAEGHKSQLSCLRQRTKVNFQF